MSAAMNGAVNIGLPDGWFPEFAKDTINAFVVPAVDTSLPEHLQDEADAKSLYTLLEEEVIPTFYRNRERWLAIMKQGMHDVVPQFDSRRMAAEYYEKLYR